MKKRVVFLTMGIVAALSLAAGCSKQTESQAQTTAAQESQTGKETESQAETEAVSETTDMGTKAVETGAVESGDIPTKIWGAITDVGESTITVDNQSPVSSAGEIIFNIDTENTYIIDGYTGLPVDLPLVQKGAFEAYLGPIMTMSLPPQTTPYMVIVNLPEDSAPAEYVISSGPIKDVDSGKVFEAIDGTEYPLADSVELSPFLTKNRVMLEDITTASRCLIWKDADGKVEKIMLFGE